MALHEAIMGAVADLTSIAINVIVKKFGYTAVKAKKIETYIFWFIFLSFISILCFITFKYS
mgnify:CR=1 FL=1